MNDGSSQKQLTIETATASDTKISALICSANLTHHTPSLHTIMAEFLLFILTVQVSDTA